jgi:hypothetical protein
MVHASSCRVLILKKIEQQQAPLPLPFHSNNNKTCAHGMYKHTTTLIPTWRGMNGMEAKMNVVLYVSSSAEELLKRETYFGVQTCPWLGESM